MDKYNLKIRKMKTITAIILSLVLSAGTTFAKTNECSHSANDADEKLHEAITKKVDFPELHINSVDQSPVEVDFSVDVNGQIVLSSVSGPNAFLRNYVSDQLYRSKIKVDDCMIGKSYHITIRFAYPEAA